MIDRLVLGDGPLVRTVSRSLADKPGRVRVGTASEDLAESLREVGVSVSMTDPTDATAVSECSGVDVVLTLAESRARNLAIARAVRTTLPDVYLIAYEGEDGDETESGLADVADKLIDPVGAVAGSILQRAGDVGRQTRGLWSVLGDIDRLAVLAHDNPDPDAIASGVALARLAETADCACDVCYFGDINHQENRAFVNVLDLDLQNLDDDDELEEYDGLALVDHSQPGVNNQLAAETPVDIVVDHHPPRSPIDAEFVDLRSSAGATSTLLTEYLDQFGLLEDEAVATALLFGIHVDTDGFVRGVAEQDFQAAGQLLSTADIGMIERIESPSMAPQTLETIAVAIQERYIDGETLLSCVGQLSDRDALAQAADRLLMLDGVSTTVVYGFDDETIYVSARARGTDIDLGETLREAFDQIGSAGGHVDMAGAQIQLGVLEAVEDGTDSLTEVVSDVVRYRFLEAVGSRVASGGHEPGDPDNYLEGESGTDPVTSVLNGDEDGSRGEGLLYTGHEDDEQPPVSSDSDGADADNGPTDEGE